jgi:hypothetical protein
MAGASSSKDLAWPVARFHSGGWRLGIAWTYNGGLLVGGLLWLVVMLRAFDIDGEFNTSGFWRTFVLALLQAYLVQDSIKVLLITFLSPAFWSRILKPGSGRAAKLQWCMRSAISGLQAII